MPEQILPRGRGGRPPRVNRAQVVAAAAELLAEGGPSGFSMRSLATRLEMSPMGIYHYFDSKNDLLSAVLAHQTWSADKPELPADPTDRLLELSRLAIEHLTRHSWIMDLQVSSETVDPFTAWAGDRALAACEELGMDVERRIGFGSALWRLVLAEATIRAGSAQRTAVTGHTEAELLATRFRDYDDLPHLREAAAESAKAPDAFSIEFVIRALLECALTKP